MKSPAAGNGVQRSGWWVVLAALGAASLLAWLIDRHVSLTIQAMVYLVGVVAVAYRCTRTQSAAAAFLSALALNFFFVPPRGTFSIDNAEHLVTLAALLAVALLISSLTANLRRETEVALLREQRARQLHGLAGELSALDDEGEIMVMAADRLRDAYGPESVLVQMLPDGGLRQSDGSLLSPDDARFDALRHCAREGRVLGPGTPYWPELPAWYLPLNAGTKPLGAAALPPLQGRADEDALQHAKAMCDLLAGALQRARHASQALAARGQAEAQSVRNALLASVSHDFRTPLASIVGSVSSLIEQRDRLSETDRERLLTRIDQEARHLVTMTENTLQWARLAGESQALQLDWQSVEEIIGTVRARVRARDPSRRLSAEVPAGLPLVRADPVLLGQLLENLVDNALKYSDGPVLIQARMQGEHVTVAVKDRGAGLSDVELETVFETFTRGVQAQGVRGAGLGLAVCRAIARAHGATLTAQRRIGGGSRFVLSLPASSPPLVEII